MNAFAESKVENNHSIKSVSHWKILTALFPYIWGNSIDTKIRNIIGVFLVVITIFFNLMVPFIFKNIINVVGESNHVTSIKNYSWLLLLLLAYGGSYTLGQVIVKARQIIFYKVIERTMRSFSLTVFNHLHDLDLKFHVQRKMGSIMGAIEKFQFAIPEIFWGLTLLVIPSLVEITLAMVILFHFYKWKYAVIVLGILLSFLASSFIGYRLTKRYQLKYEENALQAHSRMVDSLLNYETVKYFNNKMYESNIFNKLLQKREESALRFRIRFDLIQIFQVIIVGIGLTVLTWDTIHEVINSTLVLGDFIVINSYLMQFIGPLMSFGWVISQVTQAFTKLDSVMDILNEKAEIIDCANPISLNSKSCNITFENVSFNYDARCDILKNVSFHIPCGNTLAIVGPTGSGKSTIARLLFRFYDVSKGSIYLNNIDIRHLSLDSLQAAMGMVSQDITLFNSTIYENILYGNLNATQGEVEAASKLSLLHDFVMQLPEGYHTPVGERGIMLSGGEKQRLAIARALLKKPAVFIFDEATSSLDTITEQQIKKNIMKASKEATTIIIAHRLSTITYADKIIFLERGEIIESGTHDELLSLNGAYMKFWKKQAKKDETFNINFQSYSELKI